MEQYAKTGETKKNGLVTLVKKMPMVWVLVKQLQSAIIQNIGFIQERNLIRKLHGINIILSINCKHVIKVKQ